MGMLEAILSSCLFTKNILSSCQEDNEREQERERERRGREKPILR